MVTRLFVLLISCTMLVASVGCDSILSIEDHQLAEPSGGTDGGVDSSGPPLGPPGCFQGTPSTDTDFYNQCTTAQCMHFDNCARLGICNGEVPPLIDPPPPPMTSSDAGAPSLPSTGCYDANARNKLIFIQGSTNFTPFIQAMAPLVAKNGYIIVWQPTSSCTGAAAGGLDMNPGKNLMKNPTSQGQAPASFYDQNGQGTPCLLGNSPNSPDGMTEITDIGDSDVFANVCPGGQSWVPGMAPYQEVGHYFGPIQAMLFVTPPPSSQRAISAEAARLVFGTGGKSVPPPTPWTYPMRMFIRSPTTGTNNILSKAIDVPNTKWWGFDTRTALAMQTAILTASATDAENTIGTLSTDYANKPEVKDSLHILFFQAKGQLCGFLPDSTPSSSDKQNVRDGHYAPWGPIHLYSKRVGGQPTAQAAAFIQPFTVPNQALIDATISGGAVPVCAMHVTRDQEMGPIKAFSPPFQCSCYYDFKVTGGTTCKMCNGPADCPAQTPACNLGFCQGT